MKIKGIPFWEQHLERFVLALAAIALIAFTAMQFVGQPNAANIGGQQVAPSEVDRLLSDRASQLADKLRSDAPAPEGSQYQPVISQFDERLKESVCPQEKLLVWQPRVGPGAEGVIAPPDTPFVIAKLPAATDIFAQQFFDTLVPEVVPEHEGLKQKFAAEPYDVNWNMVAARFKVADVLQQWRTGGPNGEMPLLSKWFNDRVDFINLKIEREERAGDQWTNAVVLDPIPGQFSFRTELAGKIDAAMRDAIVKHAADPAVRASIIQPEFYPTKASAWSPPGAQPPPQAGAQGAANNPEDPIAELKGQIAKLTEERGRVEAKLRELNCPDEAPTPAKPPPGNRGRGGGGTSAPGSGNPGDGGRGGGMMGGPTPTVNERECKNLRTRLKGLTASIDRFQAQLDKLQGEQPKEEPKVEVEEVKPPEDTIWVWGHDLDVVPGKTYRYRVTVEIYNPLFARRLDLIPAQQAEAERFLLASAPSEWSAPITVHPPLRLFVTHARAGGQQTSGIGPGAVLGQATAEVYRFRDGRWWRENFTVHPGDRIGLSARGPRDNQPQIDFATDWFVLDVVEAVGVDRDAIEGGTGAIVLLQNLGDQAASQVRRPAEDKSNSERRNLRTQADAAAQLAGAAGSTD